MKPAKSLRKVCDTDTYTSDCPGLPDCCEIEGMLDEAGKVIEEGL